MLGGRPLRFVVGQVFEPRNYIALARIVLLCSPRFDVARRYFLGGGNYPFTCSVRTPLGRANAKLYSHHDVWTLSEVFCREDYRAGSQARVFVDVGSNIGLSALYFLTRNRESRCYLYEPDPRNVKRLRHNLDPFADRWSVEEAAVGPRGGVVEFGREPTGRYGAVGARTADVIKIRCLEINQILEHVVARETAIDILKIDTEGLEEETVAAIRPDLLDRVATIYFETTSPAPLHSDRFDFWFANETVRLTRREPASPARR